MSEETTKPEENPKAEEQSEYAHVCPECHTGVFHLEYLTYFTWLNDELITVPNFPPGYVMCAGSASMIPTPLAG